jgi:hypothetical protein
MKTFFVMSLRAWLLVALLFFGAPERTTAAPLKDEWTPATEYVV